MPSAFERRSIQRLVDQAHAMGIDVPDVIAKLVCTGGPSNGGAILWARAYPDEDGPGCCWGEATRGPEGCTCWVPVFDTVQADPIPPAGPEDIQARDAMCGDCAFRKGSPERAQPHTEEALLSLPAEKIPFYCHDNMRRPVRWEHPDGRSVAGSPDDWQPPLLDGVPYRLDGRPGLMCAGWVARAARSAR